MERKRKRHGLPMWAKAAIFAAVVLTVICAAMVPAMAADATPDTSPASTTTTIIVYPPGTIAPGDYTVIDRAWVSRKRTAFDMPRHRDVEAAQNALLQEAARLGGDGVVNMHCMHSTGVIAAWGGYYCYGNVIKLKAPLK